MKTPFTSKKHCRDPPISTNRLLFADDASHDLSKKKKNWELSQHHASKRGGRVKVAKNRNHLIEENVLV